MRTSKDMGEEEEEERNRDSIPTSPSPSPPPSSWSLITLIHSLTHHLLSPYFSTPSSEEGGTWGLTSYAVEGVNLT